MPPIAHELMSSQKAALKTAVSAYPEEAPQVSKVLTALKSSGGHDGHVNFSADTLAWICDTLAPWTEASFPEQHESGKAKMVKDTIRQLSRRLEGS